MSAEHIWNSSPIVSLLLKYTRFFFIWYLYNQVIWFSAVHIEQVIKSRKTEPLKQTKWLSDVLADSISKNYWEAVKTHNERQND